MLRRKFWMVLACILDHLLVAYIVYTFRPQDLTAACSPCWYACPMRRSWWCFAQGVCTPAVGIHLSRYIWPFPLGQLHDTIAARSSASFGLRMLEQALYFRREDQKGAKACGRNMETKKIKGISMR